MKQVIVRQAKSGEIDWINSRYGEVNFVDSQFDHEFIAIAEVKGERAGIGRLVFLDDENIELGGIYVFPEFRRMGVADKIVDYLRSHDRCATNTVWCLPFSNLHDFYARFGFQVFQGRIIPDEIAAKLTWCNTSEKYERDVLLMRYKA